ncbi:MAG: serine/threonine-protein phosphatase [Phycisphaeraceae bacterium]|nr:serine/threonine-protein phosphatase [Phycisphaeraceae bacterium]
MQSHSLALIAPAGSEASRPGWWEPILRAWPGVPPRVEHLSPEQVLSTSRALKPSQTWDAAAVAPFPASQDSLLYKLADVLQQALVPTLLLLDDNPDHNARLEGFNPGSIVTQRATVDPRSLAGLLFGLSQRQPAVRALDQTVRMTQSFQGETAAEIDRLHQELLLAAKVQRDFLPKRMPMLDGLGCSVLYRPAGFVSGDTYDVCQLDEYHIGFFLADAMGHGVPAALMTLYISGSIPRKEIGPGPHGGYRLIPPAESLKRLNAELADSIAGPARFATAICGLVDVRTGLITLAAAGHPPPLRIGPHGVRPINVSGMLLGVVPDFEYQQVTVRLEEDEILVIHSDGIESAFARNARPGEAGTPPIPPHFAHFAQMRRGDALASLGAAMDRLADDLDAQTGSLHQDDDVTVLAFQSTCVRETTRAGAIDHRAHHR